MFEIGFKNKFLERILRLTEKGEIKWKKTETVAKNCERWLGIGVNHKFVIVEYDKNIDYVIDDYIGYVNKYITDVENSWDFVFDRHSEIEDFIYIMKSIIKAKENCEGEKPQEMVDIVTSSEFTNLDNVKIIDLEKVKRYYRQYINNISNEAELLKQKDKILNWLEISKNNVLMKKYHEENLKIVNEKLSKLLNEDKKKEKEAV